MSENHPASAVSQHSISQHCIQEEQDALKGQDDTNEYNMVMPEMKSSARKLERKAEDISEKVEENKDIVRQKEKRKLKDESRK